MQIPEFAGVKKGQKDCRQKEKMAKMLPLSSSGILGHMLYVSNNVYNLPFRYTLHLEDSDDGKCRP